MALSPGNLPRYFPVVPPGEVVFLSRLKARLNKWARIVLPGTFLMLAAAQAQTVVEPDLIDCSSGEAGGRAREQKQEQPDPELKQDEHKRILGILPNFNSTTVQNAPRLSPGHKMKLATRTALDPFTFGIAGISAGISQAENSYAGYGQGGAGYAKRFGAAYADSFNGTIIGNGLLPIVFHQDPRYFRKGSGGFWARTLHATLSTVRAKSDSGKWMPNYSNLLGNLAAGGISNLYYPGADRGVGLTFERGFTVTAQGTLGAFLVEFWPDVVAHHRHKKNRTHTP